MLELKIYQSYGKFAIEFETLQNRIVIAIIFAFSRFGMTNQALTKVLLSDLTGYPLITKYQSIISIIYQEEPETLKHIEPLFKFLKNINEERNEIIHGRHLIYNKSNDNESTTRVKVKISKNGLKTNEMEVTSEYYDKLTEKLQLANHLISHLQLCLDLNKKVIDIIPNDSLEKLK